LKLAVKGLELQKNDKNIVRVRDIIQTGRRLTASMIGEQLELSHTTVHQILTDDLEMKKICNVKIVPKNLL